RVSIPFLLSLRPHRRRAHRIYFKWHVPSTLRTFYVPQPQVIPPPHANRLAAAESEPRPHHPPDRQRPLKDDDKPVRHHNRDPPQPAPAPFLPADLPSLLLYVILVARFLLWQRAPPWFLPIRATSR